VNEIAKCMKLRRVRSFVDAESAIWCYIERSTSDFRIPTL